MNKSKTVMVFNTCSSQYEEISVSEDVYNEYRRGDWRIEKANAKYRANELPFSAMISGEDRSHENFREFVDAVGSPGELVLKSMQRDALYQAIKGLNRADQRLIKALFFEGNSEQTYASKLGITQQAISKQKKKVVKKLRKILISWL